MDKILIELILTNRCNKRCEYCDLKFQNQSLSFNDLDIFIEFLSKNRGEYSINFFGGEPLLEFKKMKYFIEKTKGVVTGFSVGTNGILLNEKILKFLIKNKVKIYLSIDNISIGADVDLLLISKYSDNIQVNFINDPDYLDNSLIVFQKLLRYGFTSIAFMPVFNTKKWNKDSLKSFSKIYNYIKKHSDKINLLTYSYFNGISIDRQFILDTDMYFYSDLDSLLWLQKQYKNIDKNLQNKINDRTKLFSIKHRKHNLNDLINGYNIREIIKLVFEIPKQAGDILNYTIIDTILKDGT